MMVMGWDCKRSIKLRFTVKMSIFSTLRLRIKSFYGPLIGVSAFLYFTYHILHGERGLIAWWQINNQIKAAKIKLIELRNSREKIERRVKLMHPENLDPDILEERARIMLNYGYPNDIVIIESKKTRK